MYIISMTKVNWKWRGKTYSGELLPDREDKDNRYARTHNGKIKTLPKKTKPKPKPRPAPKPKKKSY